MILRVQCPDEKGLVYKISKILYDNGLNVVTNGEFVDIATRQFFMRTEFTGDCDPVEIQEKLRLVLPIHSIIHLTSKRKKRIVLMASKEHQCLTEVLLRCEYNELSAQILSVISNHNKLASHVERFGIPFHKVSHQGISREVHEKLIVDLLESYDFDYLVLAKYMRILTPDFVHRFSNRIINIHHSFLPAFKGANPYRQAFNRGVKIIGATAHFVNEDLDEGPIIAQDITRIDHRDAPQEMSLAGKDIEKMVLAKALKLVFEERVFLHGNKTIIL